MSCSIFSGLNSSSSQFISHSFDRSSYSSLPGHGSSVLDEYRIVELEPDNDPVVLTPYQRNKITTHRYTIVNFVPKNLFEQFRRVGNFYFLMSAIISTLTKSPISPLTSWLPLIFVIMVTACKQGYENYKKYRSDQRVNSRAVTVIRRKCSQEIFSEEIVVGDIVRVNRDEDVPCDLVVLYSSEPSGTCYVTTSNLDGETNLKTLHVPKVLTDLEIDQVVSMRARLTCILPTAGLYTFEGKIEASVPEARNGPLDINNLALRGARLKDTDFVIGCAVYTGDDTKLSLNSQISIHKVSTIEKSVNKYIFCLLVFLLLEVLLCYVLKASVGVPEKFDEIYLRSYQSNSQGWLDVISDLLGFTILFNFVVPISLYVTIEMQSFLGAFYFGWDKYMYDEASKQPAVANTSELNEDLGQIEYLFSDKTGTLTDNLMIFRRCYVDGAAYAEKECDGNLYLLPDNGKPELAERVELWTPEVWHFMISISLCHEVHIAPAAQKAKAELLRAEYRESFRLKKTQAVDSSLMMDPRLPLYEAASVDEKALVEAAARCGVVFQGDNDSDVIEIDAKGTLLTYERLDVFEFTSDRKRMSVVIKDSAEDVWLYCKGADSSVFPLVLRGQIIGARSHVTDFSRRGLRTLVMGYKKFTKDEYETFSEEVKLARQTMGSDRARAVEQVYEQIENGLTLLGVSAVEDRLQDDVAETMEKLRVAGIKVWVLTGDKAETAENIGYICGHFKPGTEIIRLTNIYSDQQMFITLISFERRIKVGPYVQYGLIVDGVSLGIALKYCPSLLRKVGMACEAVLCCRMSPLQKSQVVRLVKNAPGNPLTAAIGDGGNDVSMIKEAHVGLGIPGKEGRQAVMNADFGFAKFRHLERALLVHGHWYYYRLAVLTQFFFYKNLVLTLPQLFYVFSNGFSGKSLYDSLFLMGFNMLFTAFPILIYGLLEQDYPADKLLKSPQYYRLNRKNSLMSIRSFAKWAILAVWQACTIFYLPYFYWKVNPVNLYNSTEADLWSFSTTVFHLVVLVINIELLILSNYWTYPFVISILLTEASLFLISLGYSFFGRSYDGDMLYVFWNLLKSPSYWLITCLVVSVCIIPPMLIGIYEAGRPERLLSKLETQEDEVSYAMYSTDTPASPDFPTGRLSERGNRAWRRFLSSPGVQPGHSAQIAPWRGTRSLRGQNRAV